MFEKHDLDRQQNTIRVDFYTDFFREQSNTLWTLQQKGTATEIQISGQRVAPWLFSFFGAQHNRYTMELLDNIAIAAKKPVRIVRCTAALRNVSSWECL